ncbi:MAG: hypothetical protein KDA33_08450 [Phycisphaerales bacterium]|nr:hypothetical protein [Phycisphaerales bacterium]
MTTKLRNTLTIVLMAMGLCLAATSGCDEYYDYAWPGDFLTPSVEPMDFSPYGYDYDMYDLFTEDI